MNYYCRMYEPLESDDPRLYGLVKGLKLPMEVVIEEDEKGFYPPLEEEPEDVTENDT